MATTTQNINTTTTLPAWYSDYLQQVMGRALGAAGEPYQPYTGQMNAALTPDQMGAYQQVRDITGAGTPDLDNAAGYYDAAAGGRSFDAGSGAFASSENMFKDASGIDTASEYQPFGAQASGLAYGAGSAATPYIQASTSPMGLSAASPYLGMAGTSFPDAASAYMSPYNSAVTDRIAQLGARNLSENLLPAVSDDFVRAGQYGSTKQRDLVGRAVRDTQESVLGQQTQALESGYQTAGQLYGQDASRYAGLAGTAGGLGTQQQQLLQSAGTGLGNLGLSQAGLINTIGSTGAGLSAADAQRQISAAQGLSGIGQAQVQASAADLARQLQAGQGLAALGQQRQNMGLQGAAALEAAGSAQQAQQQRGLDTAYSQFQQQQNYPWQQIGNLSNVIQGLPVNTSSSSTQTTSGQGPNVLSQVGGIGAGLAGLAGAGVFKAKGGAVKKKGRVSYGVTPRRGLSFYSEMSRAA